MASKTLLTVEQFLELDLPEDRRYELDEGEIVEVTLPSPEHNATVRRIFLLLVRWEERNRGIGRTFMPDMPYRLAADTLRGPDISFVRTERLSAIDPKRPVDGAPDLAVDVVSPSDRRTQLYKKVTQYLAAGALEVWLVYTNNRQVIAVRDTGERVLTAGEIIDAPDILPGFSAGVSDFFTEPDARAC